jgi:hypothetical protein
MWIEYVNRKIRKRNKNMETRNKKIKENVNILGK